MAHIRAVLNIAPVMGRIFLFIGIVSCTPLVVAALYREFGLLAPMASAPVLFIITGLILGKIPTTNKEPTLGVSLASVALIWLVCSFIGALPFFFGIGMPYTDSVFEAMSGWTSTGLTLMASVDQAPHTILFWRSLTQWMGGIGIVAFTVAMISRSSMTHFRLYRSEGRSEAFMPNVVDTASQMWKIYIILTVAGICLVLFSGIELWDAINISMTAIATGGFSVHSAGIMYYHNPLLEMLIIPIMIAGALPFKLYYLMYHQRKLRFFGDSQAHLLIALIIFGTLVVAYDLISMNISSFADAFRESLFMVTSAITCTGFNNADPFVWSSVTVLFISMLMLIGGSSGSTAGGIKLSRIILGYEALVWWFNRIFRDVHVYVPFRHEGKPIENKIAEYEISKNMLIIILFFITVFIATLMVLHFDVLSSDSSDALFDVISAMSNVGLSTGFVNPGMSLYSKWLFIFIMWFGRLEMLPVIVLAMGLVRGFRSTKV